MKEVNQKCKTRPTSGGLLVKRWVCDNPRELGNRVRKEMEREQPKGGRERLSAHTSANKSFA